MKIKTAIIGDAQVLGRLANLNRQLRSKIVRSAINEGTKAPYRAMKANAKSVSRTVSKSIGRKVKVYRNSGVAVGIVGPRKGFARDVTLKGGRVKRIDPTRIAHLLEKGTRHSRAFPFARPAADTTKAESTNAVISTLQSGVEQACR